MTPNSPCQLFPESASHYLSNLRTIDLDILEDGNTNYFGPRSQQVWKAIYAENCIISGNSCVETELLFDFISAFHTLTTMSIIFDKKVQKGSDSRVFNSTLNYFDKKIAPSYDARYKSLFSALSFVDETMNDNCPERYQPYLPEIKAKLENVTALIACVECEKCRVHALVAMDAYIAAVKINLNEEITENQRNALIFLRRKLQDSVTKMEKLNEFYSQRIVAFSDFKIFYFIFLFLFLCIIFCIFISVNVNQLKAYLNDEMASPVKVIQPQKIPEKTHKWKIVPAGTWGLNDISTNIDELRERLIKLIEKNDKSEDFELCTSAWDSADDNESETEDYLN